MTLDPPAGPCWRDPVAYVFGGHRLTFIRDTVAALFSRRSEGAREAILSGINLQRSEPDWFRVHVDVADPLSAAVIARHIAALAATPNRPTPVVSQERPARFDVRHCAGCPTGWTVEIGWDPR